MTNKKTDLVESYFSNFNAGLPLAETVEKKPVTVWLPIDYKDRYAILQDKTKCRFGKSIQEMMMKAIDLVDDKAS